MLRRFVRRALFAPEAADTMPAWGHGKGFSVPAALSIEADDKAGRERLLRYCARPIFARERRVWDEVDPKN